MLLATNTGSLVLAWDEQKKILYFASEASAFEGIEENFFGLTFERSGFPIHEVNEDIAYLVNKRGITLLRKLKRKEYTTYYQPEIGMDNDYGYDWNRGSRIITRHPYEGASCGAVQEGAREHYNIDSDDELFCPTCSYRAEMPAHQADPGYCPECNSILEII